MVAVGPVWSGTFLTFAQAAASVPTEPDHKLSLFAQAKWLDRQAALASRSVSEESQIQPPSRPTNLPFAAAVVNAKIIVDFGGGSGWVRQFLYGLKGLERFLVVDVESVVRRFGEVATSQLEFVTADSPVLDDLAGITDILYSNSTLQYLPDNVAFCDVVRRVRPALVLLDEVLWSSTGSDWFTVQVNSIVPAVARFASIDVLVADLATIGYRLTWKDNFGREGYAFPVMENLPRRVRISHALVLAFSRGSDDDGD